MRTLVTKHRSIISFAGVGLISTILDLCVLKISLLIGLNVYLAISLGFFTGLTNGYILNSRFVFKQDPSHRRYFKYFLISLGGYFLTLGIVYLLHDRSGWLSPIYAKLIAVVIVFFWNYILSKLWAFK